jgi:hypothetical protein
VDTARLEPGEQTCPRCGLSYLAVPFRPPAPVPPVVASLAEAGPGGAVPCGRHAGNAAVGSCSRCGVFMCSLCRIEAEGKDLCPGCFDRLSAEGVLATVPTRAVEYPRLSLAVGFVGLFCFLGVLTGPITLFLVYRGVRQKRLTGERGGALDLSVAALLGVAQIVESCFLLARMARLS